MIALIQRGLRDRRRGLFIWSLALGSAGAFYMLLWPSIADSIGAISNGYPDALKEAFSLTTLSSPEEYLTVEQFSLILPVAVAVFAIRIVASTLNGAQERGYLDVLLSAPVSRRTLVTAMFVAIGLELAVILFVAWAMTCLASAIVSAGLDPGLAAAGYATVWPLAIFAAGLAMLVTGASRHATTVTGLAAGALVAMYLVDLLGRLADSVEAIRYLSVFRYYGSAGIDGLDPAAWVGMAVAGAVLAGIGTLLFERRDIAT